MYQFVSCLLTSCLSVSAVHFVSLSHFVHLVSSVSYPQSHCVSHVALVSANLSHCCLLCLSECCLLSHSSLRVILVSHGLVSCLSNSAMNLPVSYVLMLSLTYPTCLLSNLDGLGLDDGQVYLPAAGLTLPKHPQLKARAWWGLTDRLRQSAPAPSRGRVGTPPLG
jgi:hypothetical protein